MSKENTENPSNYFINSIEQSDTEAQFQVKIHKFLKSDNQAELISKIAEGEIKLEKSLTGKMMKVDAEKFIKSYNNKDIPPSTLVTKIENNYKRVKGFSFHRDEILEVLNNPSHKIEGIHLAFGINDGSIKDSFGGPMGKKGVTIIMHGIDDNGNPVLEDNYIFDYSKPCPGNCPGSGTFEW